MISVTSGFSTVLLRGQLRFAKLGGFDVYLLTSPDHGSADFALDEGATLIPIPMEREISPLADLRSAFHVLVALRRLRPEIVNASTPKAGFLVILAARITGVPVRIVTLRGFRSSTLGGIRGWAVRRTEKVSCDLATRVFCISNGMRDEAIARGLVVESKAVVLASGSSNGVDVGRYSPSPETQHLSVLLRERLRIPDRAPVIGFVGRLTREKGVVELLDAWNRLRVHHPTLHLIVVGAHESGDPLPATTRQELERHDNVHLLGHLANPAPAYAVMDVLVLPTYREGFGNVLLEAAAMGKPTVASRVDGCVEAVSDGETGILVPPGDVAALESVLDDYLQNPAMAQRHGEAGRRRVGEMFSSDLVWDAQLAEYERLIDSLSERSRLIGTGDA